MPDLNPCENMKIQSDPRITYSLCCKDAQTLLVDRIAPSEDFVKHPGQSDFFLCRSVRQPRVICETRKKS